MIGQFLRLARRRMHPNYTNTQNALVRWNLLSGKRLQPSSKIDFVAAQGLAGGQSDLRLLVSFLDCASVPFEPRLDQCPIANSDDEGSRNLRLNQT